MPSIPSSPPLPPDLAIQPVSEFPSPAVTRLPTPPSREYLIQEASAVSHRAVQRDETYYFETISFLVEDCLFNVPKYHFVKSSGNFMKENDLEGMSNQVPLTLDGISKVDFQRFLKVIYPLDFVPSMNKPTEEWVSVLKLSTRWHFDVLRELALSQLTNVEMNPVERVVLAKQFNMWQWLRSGYESLVTRPEMISLEEAEQIGYSTVHTLYRTREERSKGSNYSCCSPPLDLEHIFAEEKWAMEAVEATYKGIELESLEPPSRKGVVESGGNGVKRNRKGGKERW